MVDYENIDRLEFIVEDFENLFSWYVTKLARKDS